MKKFFVFLLVGTIIFLTYRFYLSAIFFKAEQVMVHIPEGATGEAIADHLYEKGLIKSPFVFKVYLKNHDLSTKLHAGRFLIPAGATLPEIVEILRSGKSLELALTIREGLTVEEIGQLLESEGLTTEEAFLNCLKKCAFDYDFLPKGYLEGYLFPDTYFVDVGDYQDRVFIDRMIDTLSKRLSALDRETILKGPYDFAQVMIMASIVEAEDPTEENRPMVAGILWKRLENNIGLGADATLRYVLNLKTAPLSPADLATDSPYNTRKYRGLPPTPINNPGLSSIKAAIYPKETEYWYYLHGEDGQIHYGKTLDEHNENKRRYLK